MDKKRVVNFISIEFCSKMRLQEKKCLVLEKVRYEKETRSISFVACVFDTIPTSIVTLDARAKKFLPCSKYILLLYVE